VEHRTNRYLNNHLEQDHRGIKQRYRPMGGFKHGTTAARFCRLFDEVRAFLRPQSHRNQSLSLKQRRAIHRDRFAQLMGLMATVSNLVTIVFTSVRIEADCVGWP
jgi:putative transposase